jgi:hypothetical protein
MTPDELALWHPRLYHLTLPEAVDGIRRHGLLPPLALLDLFEADEATRARVLTRRPERMALSHPVHGTAVVTDNAPLNDDKLARVLDDGLSPDDWRRMLAERVFFWTSEEEALRLAGARLNRGEPRVLLVFDTLSLARAHGTRMEITPINTGQTLYVPTRRGLATFAPLLGTDYDAWTRRRGLRSPDRIREVTVCGAVPDAADHLVEVRPAGRHAAVA